MNKKLKNKDFPIVCKNYKVLCETLEINNTTGKSKQIQINKLNKIFNMKKSGRKYIIYSQNQEYTPRASCKMLVDCIKYKIMHLKKINKISLFKIYRRINMVNDNFLKHYGDSDFLKEKFGIPVDISKEFFSNTSSFLKRNLIKSMDTMENSSHIFWGKDVSVVELDVSDPKLRKNNGYKSLINDINKDITAEYNISMDIHSATEAQKLAILKVEQETLKKLNSKTKSDLVKRGQYGEFKEIVLKQLLETHNIVNYYDNYSTTTLKQDENLRTQNNIKQCLKDRIMTNAENRQNKQKKQPIDKYKYRESKNYLKHFEKMCDYFIF